MKKKIGPLPIWAWAAVGAAIGLFLYYRSKSSSSSSASTNLNQVDPSNPLGLTYAQENADITAGIDPNTGQTYAAEQSSADQGAAGGGGSGDSGSTDDSAAIGQLDTDINSGFATLSTQLAGGEGLSDSTTPGETFLGEVQDVQGVVSALGLNLGVSAPATAAAASNGASGGGSGTITTHPGGAFYNFYEAVMGKAPPTTVNTSSLVYAAWKAGKTVSATKTLVKGTGSGSAGSAGGKTTVKTSVANKASAAQQKTEKQVVATSAKQVSGKKTK